jgi:hypothetical protein
MAVLQDFGVFSGPQVLLRLAGSKTEPCACTLLGITHGKMHLRSEQWIEPASLVSATFNRLTVSGEVLYCTWKDAWYRTSIDLISEDDQRRREPRLLVGQHGTVISLSGNGNDFSAPGVLIDLAVSGMRLEVPRHADPGTMIYVETESALIVGEVRHCHQGPTGSFEAGVQITDILSDRNSRQNTPGFLHNVRRKLAQAILGAPIPTSRR